MKLKTNLYLSIASLMLLPIAALATSDQYFAIKIVNNTNVPLLAHYARGKCVRHLDSLFNNIVIPAHSSTDYLGLTKPRPYFRKHGSGCEIHEIHWHGNGNVGRHFIIKLKVESSLQTVAKLKGEDNHDRSGHGYKDFYAQPFGKFIVDTNTKNHAATGSNEDLVTYTISNYL